MTDPLIPTAEVLAKAADIYGDYALTDWYEALLAERKERRDNVKVGTRDNVTITVGKTYDLTMFQSVRKPHSFQRQDRETVLRGWTFLGKAGYATQYLRMQKHPKDRDWGGVVREVRQDLILDAVEVTA
jgi:hypothetical protein